MDILTQGLLGSALAQSVSRQKEVRFATTVGFMAGLVADADVLIHSSADPLLGVEYHRHFTHSIFFIPIGALIAAGLLWLFVRKRMEFGRLYVFCLAGYSLSGFIDACTSYGTHLLWPLYGGRISFHIISIVDPIFTGILLLAVVWANIKHLPRAAHLGLALCSVYLLLGVAQKHRATVMAEQLAQSRGHSIERLVVKPTLGNILLWRSTYINSQVIHVDALRPGITAHTVYPGQSIKLFVPQRDAADLPRDSVLYRDILRFQRFSDGFIAMDPVRHNVLGDMRYSMLPHTTTALWGITLDRSHPQRHSHYEFYRDNTEQDRTLFWLMILGEHTAPQGS